MSTVIGWLPEGVDLTGPVEPAYERVLTAEALQSVARLERRFGADRLNLLANRVARQAELDAGHLPDFLPETAEIRNGDWQIAGVPADLQDRRVEITGPAGDRKMVINAFNSGARVFMADFEDANSPTWNNTVQGQVNLHDAIRRTIDYVSPEGKSYALQPEVATLVVRPRGWHLEERHVTVDGRPVSGGLFDFGLYLFHNAQSLLEQGTGPYFYLPKLECHEEARLWNQVFTFAEEHLDIPTGSIKATVLIETILAAFEMDEILYELRHHVVGLNCGRWDYIFSVIKKLRNHHEFLLPDRASITMASPFMRAYSLLAIQTCHKRGAHAIGGMAAQIPVKDNPAANQDALHKVRADKVREATDGHDGTWVAHPALVPVAMAAFDEHMATPNQVHRKREDVSIAAADLLEAPSGSITEHGLRNNISVAVQYMEAWLGGAGAVPIYNLMEDAATAEIARTQVWQWIHHPQGYLGDGRRVTEPLVRELLREELEKIREHVGAERFENGNYRTANQLFLNLIGNETMTEFLTIPGYTYLD